MTTINSRLRRTALATGASLLLTLGGALVGSPAGADWIPAETTDCFGNPLFLQAALVVPSGGAPFFGTVGDDVIIGTDGADSIYGLEGDDIICGGDGEDSIHGDGGNDDIDGERGTDRMYGGGGDDYILGGTNTVGSPYREALYGDDGNDYLLGQSGPDTLLCGNALGVGGDPGDIADGGTGMAGSLPEDDYVWVTAHCPVIANVP